MACLPPAGVPRARTGRANSLTVSALTAKPPHFQGSPASPPVPLAAEGICQAAEDAPVRRDDKLFQTRIHGLA